MKKLLVFGIIVLFIGLAFIPSFNAVSISKKDNNPPSKPTITGPNGGRPGIMYTFNFNAEDPDGDNVSYWIEWGDGESDGWSPYTSSGTNMPIGHTWDKICDYPIRAKAKDIYGMEGDWSNLIIRINRYKPQIIDIESTIDCDCNIPDAKLHLAEKVINKAENYLVSKDLIMPDTFPFVRPVCKMLESIAITYAKLFAHYMSLAENSTYDSPEYWYYYRLAGIYLIITFSVYAVGVSIFCWDNPFPPYPY